MRPALNQQRGSMGRVDEQMAAPASSVTSIGCKRESWSKGRRPLTRYARNRGSREKTGWGQGTPARPRLLKARPLGPWPQGETPRPGGRGVCFARPPGVPLNRRCLRVHALRAACHSARHANGRYCSVNGCSLRLHRALEWRPPPEWVDSDTGVVRCQGVRGGKVDRSRNMTREYARPVARGREAA